MDFIETLKAAGFKPPKQLQPGKFERFPGIGKSKGDAGWAVLFADGKGGVYGDWTLGQKWTWGNQDMPDRKKMEQQRRERESKTLEEHRKVARMALQILAETELGETGYTRRKGIGPQLKRGWEVIVPILDWDEVVNVQRIQPDGEKRFLKGGKVRGCHAWAENEGRHSVFVCEGYATGVSVAKIFPGNDVACAMSCDNMAIVAERFVRDGYKVTIAGDNDRFAENNPGVTKALEIGNKLDLPVVVPDFPVLVRKGNDFNDLDQWVTNYFREKKRVKRFEDLIKYLR